MRRMILRERVRRRIRRSKEDVFLVREFVDLSDRDQVLRALRELLRDRVLLRLGKGVYAKARKSSVSDRYVPCRNLRDLAIATMGKLNVPVGPTRAEADYNARRTTQVPNGFVLGVAKRVSRKLSFNGTEIRYERIG